MTTPSQVELTDGRSMTAKLVGMDPPTDTAVLRVDTGGLPNVKLGDSRSLKVWAIVVFTLCTAQELNYR